MKIDRTRPVHWLLLAVLFLQGLAGLGLRLLRRPRAGNTAVLYGHKLNGNLLALREAMIRNPLEELVPVFLTMDLGYARTLRASGIRCTWACSPHAAMLLSTASALVSDHGLHSMQPFVDAFRRAGLRFFDVWHGIPFKGFDAADFTVQHRYDEVWVASDLCRELYVGRFGFSPRQVVATGYARTDRLLRPPLDTGRTRASLGLPKTGPLILFAPTWKQDSRGRSLYPFGCSEEDFLRAVAEMASRHGGAAVLRQHLNSGGECASRVHPDVYILPAAEFPDTESVLFASDVLVCDWSSIAFDYLLLDRPVVFLDVEPPFKKGFSLGPEYRFGPVAAGLKELLALLDAAVDPEKYWPEHGPRHEEVKSLVYGDFADGKAADRCLERLHSHVGPVIRSGFSR